LSITSCSDAGYEIARAIVIFVDSLFGTESMPALLLSLLASGGEALALIALCVRLSGAGPSRDWQPLAATSRTGFLARLKRKTT
jgi:hypothetical protein